ncbi:hypothetical protein [Streptomyces sp. NPDC047974]|uniref:hypothetical protein n=1 Tax=Streptomyces sp. NPDC047974 TaxID=3154343 RepID=UPI0033C7B7B5
MLWDVPEIQLSCSPHLRGWTSLRRHVQVRLVCGVRVRSSVRIFDAFARMDAAFSGCGSIARRSRSGARRAGLISLFAISTANGSGASSTA